MTFSSNVKRKPLGMLRVRSVKLGTLVGDGGVGGEAGGKKFTSASNVNEKHQQLVDVNGESLSLAERWLIWLLNGWKFFSQLLKDLLEKISVYLETKSCNFTVMTFLQELCQVRIKINW